MGLKNKIINYIKATKYNIGFVDGDMQSVLDGKPIKINWLKHNYKDRWFADPFILDVTDKEIVVLVEEWYDPIQRGRVSKLTIDRITYGLKELTVILESDTHLSFPAIDRREDGIYIHPESSATNNLIEYRYDEIHEQLVEGKVICERPLTDSVFCEAFGEKLMFSTKLPDANGKELGIYLWDNEVMQYKIKDYHHFNENLSRMAGNFFTYKGRVYRPAQVCIKSYGDAVSIQEVSHTNGIWKFKEIRRLYSPNPDLDLGFHTFNIFKGVIVVDAIGYRRAKLCHLIRKIKHMMGL